MVCCGILCYSLDGEEVRALAVPFVPVQAPSKPLPPVIWFNDLKIVDRVYITPQGLKGVRRDVR
jgi:hypothetical protein